MKTGLAERLKATNCAKPPDVKAKAARGLLERAIVIKRAGQRAPDR